MPTYYLQHGSSSHPPMLTERVTARIDKYDGLCVHYLGHWHIVHTAKDGGKFIFCPREGNIKLLEV